MAWIRVVVAIASVLLLTLFLAPFQLVGLWLNLPLCRSLPVLWHRATCFILGIKVHCHGEMSDSRPLMLVANHVSWLDIVALGSIGELCFVAKSDMRSWPFFGWLARLQRTIFVEREDRRKAGQQVSAISERLASGEVVVLFPEGTTSDGNYLLGFKSSLFGAATAALPHSPTHKVHVQPVALAYTRVHGMPMGRYHRPIASWPGDIALGPHLLGVLKEGAIDVDVTFGAAIEVNETSNRKRISRDIENSVRTMLNEKLRGRV
jgi:lyso-ornithine lipid O-acyltransferase